MGLLDGKPLAVIDNDVHNCSARAYIYVNKYGVAVVFKQTGGLKSLTNAIEDVMCQFNFNYRQYLDSNKHGVKVRVFQFDHDSLSEIKYTIKSIGLRSLIQQSDIKIEQWITITKAYEVLYL